MAAAPAAAIGANIIRGLPFFLRASVTISHLGVRITTLSAGGNLQLAIYAHRIGAVAGIRPGLPLAVTGNIATDSAVNVNGALVGGNKYLPAGLYWALTNNDNGVVRLQAFDTTNVQSDTFGAAAQNDVSTSAANGGWNYNFATQTFGTWPDIGAASFSQQNANNVPLLQFKVA